MGIHCSRTCKFTHAGTKVKGILNAPTHASVAGALDPIVPSCLLVA